jgi:site-specific DNA recombinase
MTEARGRSPSAGANLLRDPNAAGQLGRSVEKLSSRGASSGSPGRPRIRCAIYTRKSTEEGLDQEFNSLDAQREACEAYIKSQKHEGWVALPILYDDPAYSGGTMERPALKKLLADIDARAIDTVVVYKVDRLTRSLADFAKIVEAFDARHVSFVSVTQAFNTTTSMGRLTLNVLLSFAQFEREVTGERIRDKIAASKKKGMWMGGLPSLGYDVKERKLIVNDTEAETARHIFRRYAELGSVRALKSELDAGGIFSKARVAADGSAYGAKSFSRGALYQMLKNRIFLGDIVHKGVANKGEHAAIVDAETWAKVQELLEAHRVARTALDERRPSHSLTGILFDAEGERMSPSHAVKKGIRYDYYVSRSLITGPRDERPLGQRIPARMLEGLVLGRMKLFFENPKAVLDAMPEDQRGAAIQVRLNATRKALLKSLEQTSDQAWRGIIRDVLRRVGVYADRVELELSAGRLTQILLGAEDVNRARDLDVDHDRDDDLDDDRGRPDRIVALAIPARLKRTGKELRFVVDGDPDPSEPDVALVRLLIRAAKLQRRIAEATHATLEEIGAREDMTASYVPRLMRLNFLAPDIVVAILEGRQPPGLTSNTLMADTRLPLDWREQRARLGFPNVQV